MLEIPIAKITPTKALPICSGESLELDAAVAGKNYNYLWSTGATTSKINVSTPGSYQVTVLNDICQAISPSMIVTVNPTPIPNLVNLGLDAFCESQSTKLSAGILPAGTTIIWQDGSTQTELFANKPGDYFFILTNDFGCSAKSATKSLTVFPNPKPIIDTPSNTNFCEGSAVMLATNLSGNYQYLWSNGNSTPSTLITTPGDYSVVVTDQNNCTGTAATVILKMLPRPVPELNYVGLQRILAGQSITLQTTKTYNTYQWSNGANTPTLTTNLSEDFHLVSVKDSNGCTNVAQTESVRILVKPTLTLLSSVLQGVAAPNALVGQYRWYKDGQQIANANATSYQPIVAGKYQIEAYYPNGSKDISDDLECIPTGFEEIAGFKDFELFPNPASENVWVRWTPLRNTEDLELHITDSSGKLISVLKNPNSAGQNIDLNNKVAGTYIATLKCVGKVVASKTFIVKDY